MEKVPKAFFTSKMGAKCCTQKKPKKGEANAQIQTVPPSNNIKPVKEEQSEEFKKPVGIKIDEPLKQKTPQPSFEQKGPMKSKMKKLCSFFS